MDAMKILLSAIVAVASFLSIKFIFELLESRKISARKNYLARFSSFGTSGSGTSDALFYNNPFTEYFAKRTPSFLVSTLQDLLNKTGNPKESDLNKFLTIKWFAAFGSLFFGILMYPVNQNLFILFALFGPFIAFFIPDMILRSQATARNEKILAELPRTIELLNLCLQAGMTIERSLKRVTASNSGPLQAELKRVLHSLELGQPNSLAFAQLRTLGANSELSNFAGTIIRAEKLGIPISGMLGQQAVEMREKSREAAKEQAAKLPVKILMPLMLFFLPALLMIVLGPAIIQIVEAF